MKQLDLLAKTVSAEVTTSDVGRTPTAADLAAWLAARLGRAVRLVLTNNRSTMLSYREADGAIDLRMHRFFLNAGLRELEATVRYLSEGDREAGATVDAFIQDQLEQVRPAPRKLRSEGRFHDLGAILADLNARFFHGRCDVSITWGLPGTRRRRRSIQLGSYSSHERLIRVHPSLDQAFVPHTYVSWVVFHEMLHEVFGVERGSGRGRRKLHPPEFNVLEETFPGYAECKEWERENLPRLLSFRPDGGWRRSARARR